MKMRVLSGLLLLLLVGVSPVLAEEEPEPAKKKYRGYLAYVSFFF